MKEITRSGAKSPTISKDRKESSIWHLESGVWNLLNGVQLDALEYRLSPRWNMTTATVNHAAVMPTSQPMSPRSGPCSSVLAGTLLTITMGTAQTNATLAAPRN